MKIIPAIDLLDGHAVRLTRGKKESAVIYSREPWSLINDFVHDGASRVHVVDLDGAFAGRTQHASLVRKIISTSTVPIQVGGGIRDLETLETMFGFGARYAVLGTAAIRDPEIAREACRRYPERVIVAVDAVDGRVAIDGWAVASEQTSVDVAARAQEWGACAVLYTDVSRDGTHGGPNVEATAALAQALEIPVIASGGVSSLADLRALKSAGIDMVVVGRALYDKHFELRDAIAAVADETPC